MSKIGPKHGVPKSLERREERVKAETSTSQHKSLQKMSSSEKAASLMHFRFIIVSLKLHKGLELPQAQKASKGNRVAVLKARISGLQVRRSRWILGNGCLAEGGRNDEQQDDS